MPASDVYKIAYERERASRLLAEQLLDEKTRSLYENYAALETTVEELKKTQEHLVHSEKMASIGQLAAGVAHEINNPIGFSLSNLTTLTQYIESFVALDRCVTENKSLSKIDFLNLYSSVREKEEIEFITEDIRNLLSDTVKGLNRVSDIVKSLKKVSHSGTLEKTHCDLNQLIEESVKVVWNELKYSMNVEREFGVLPIVDCHEGEINQVMMNLFINAAHACEDNPPDKKGKLKIKTFSKIVDKDSWVIIEVADNGKGMSTEVMKRIFDPFFTTKPVGVGTGLGLSISFGIVQRHGGTITLTSVENEGTQFTICLPATCTS